MNEKLAYTPAEFAALFGKEKTWTYRLLYAKKIVRLHEGWGQIMIPAAEAKRIAGDVTHHKADAEPQAKPSDMDALPPSGSKGSDRWLKWVSKRSGRKERKHLRAR